MERKSLKVSKKSKGRTSDSSLEGEPLHLSHRPQELSEVVGQPTAVRSLEKLMSSPTKPHAFLFTGPSGVGKTTIARILGFSANMNVSSPQVLEIDAATNSGVDDMRQIKSYVETPAFGQNPNRLLIIDECHSLSKNAWQSWLKIVEEPPSHLFIIFCTTEAGKVPRTIKTRCHTFNLVSIPVKDLVSLMAKVCILEGKSKSKFPEEWLRIISNKADGSARQALVYLSMCMGNAKNKTDVLRILDDVEADGDIPIKICRAIINSESFWKVLGLINELESDNVEGVRILTCNYAAKMLMGMKSKSKKAGWVMQVLEEMSEEFNPALKKAPLILAAGRLLF